MKKIKDFLNKLYLGSTDVEWLDSVSDWVYDHTVRPYYRYKDMIGRMLYWGWHMRWSWDFDSHTVYEMLHRKLVRVQESILDGHCDWEATEREYDMPIRAKLVRAIELSDKLWKRDDLSYLSREWDDHDAKWGELRFESTPVGDKKYTRLEAVRSGVVTDADREQEKREWKELRERSYRARQSDKKELFNILDEYLEYWWD